MNEVILTVLFKNNQVKGFLGPNTSYPNSIWWDKETKVAVPKADWEAEKVTVSSIRHYFNR